MRYSALPYLSLLKLCLSTSEVSQYVLQHERPKGYASDGHTAAADVSLKWHPPKKSFINDLTSVVNGTDIYDFVFDSSKTPATLPYSTYNWCNMPHVRRQEYPVAPGEYKLEYVEVIHRHHKRTPYASNMFPYAQGIWRCDDIALYYYGAPQPGNDAAAVKWRLYTSPSNPFSEYAFRSTCQFPQITAGGLIDSRQHGRDLIDVYHDLLHFLPDHLDSSKVIFRATNNQITSQVAGQVIYGMFPSSNGRPTQVLVQPSSVDSLEPTYPCPKAKSMYSRFGIGSNNPAWLAHLQDRSTRDLFATLDAVSSISPEDSGWHESLDHYFDNLSARLCHRQQLPCNGRNPSLCVSQEDANAVFRRGEYEYSFIYRDSPDLFEANVLSYGAWMNELADNLRSAIAGAGILYRHNFGHDGSMARLLSVLQVDTMVWPGMGAEVVFELYSKQGEWFLRVLWSGQILTSSNPTLGKIDMLPVEIFLAYIEGLVWKGARRVRLACSADE